MVPKEASMKIGLDADILHFSHVYLRMICGCRGQVERQAELLSCAAYCVVFPSQLTCTLHRTLHSCNNTSGLLLDKL